MQRMTAYVLSVLIALPSVSLANGAGGHPGINGITLVPMQVDTIQMVSERVDIDLVKGTVHCLFRLRNLQSAPQTITMLFPFDPFYSQDDEDSFAVTIRGEDQDVILKDLEPKNSLPFTQTYKRGASWSVSFAAGEELPVECEYRVSPSGSFADTPLGHEASRNPLYDDCSVGSRASRAFTYITRTGALWANSIERAEFRVIASRELLLALPPADAFNTSCLNASASLSPPGYSLDRGSGTISWTFTNWKPNRDIGIRWESRTPATGGYEIFKYKRYTAHERLYRLDELPLIRWQDGSGDESWGVPYIDKDFLSYLRNEVFARHGKIFDNKDLQAFFASTLWYGRAKGPVVLNNIETKNVEHLKALEDNLDRLVKYFSKRRYDGDRVHYTSETIATVAGNSKYLRFLFSSLLRNEVYARRGRCFKNPFYTAFFNTTLWYRQNCQQPESPLNEVEQRNVDLLLNLENTLGKEIGVQK